MNDFLTLKCVLLLFIFFQIQLGHAQTLSKGEIGFVGFNTDSPDGFAWIALTNIPAGEVIYFSDQGWTGSEWFVNTERHITWTAPVGGISCGTVVRVDGTGTTSGTYTGTYPSLSAGDQVLAYQGGAPATPTPTFLAGVHGDYNSSDYNMTTTWNNGGSTINGSASVVPTGLENGTNCVSLFPGVLELDNARYNGSLTGTIAQVRADINDQSKWEKKDVGAYSIEPVDFSGTVDCSALPVELVSFSARPSQGDAKLEWTTASEINNEGFEIERLGENEHWEILGFENGAGNSNNINTYIFYDEKPREGINYYRLKQIDFDGKFEYSNIESVQFKIDASTILVFPNPANDWLTFKTNQTIEVQILNINGQVLFRKKINATEKVSIEFLPIGLYFIKTGEKIQRIIIQR